MKKNSIPMIIIWVVYGLVTGVGLFVTAMALGAELGFGTVPGLAAGLVAMLLLGVAVRAAHLAAQKRRPREEQGRQLLPVIVESLALILCLIGMTALRLMTAWDVAADPVFEAAKVTEDAFWPVTSHRGMEIYLWLLHGILLLLGNKAFGAAALQIVLLICAMLSLYFGVRRLSGAAAAFVMTCFVGFAPYMMEETRRLTPLPLFFIFFGLAAGCIGAIPECMRGTKTTSGRVRALLYYFAAGILIGFCCYLDASGIALLIFLTGVLCRGDREMETERRGLWENSVLVFLVCVLWAVLGYAASHGARCLLGGGSLAASVYGQLASCRPGGFQIPFTMNAGTAFWDIPVLAALMAAGIFGFWCSRRIGDKIMWLCAAALLALLQCFGVSDASAMSPGAVLYLCCAVLAGCSVSDALASGERPVAAGTENSAEKASAGETAAEETDAEKLEILDLQPGQPPAIQYIENPLPLPKKKVHKALDYDYEVADDDDFDIP